MKTARITLSTFVFATLLLFSGCNDDEDPVIENEEELITTVRLTLTEGDNTLTFDWKDLDGDGANPPVVDDIVLQAGKTYSVAVTLLNESVTPAENISEEVAEEAGEHQLFFLVSDGLGLEVSYSDEDDNGNPLGLEATFTTGDSASGTLTVVLRHEPNKLAPGVADGDITNAGGETDIETTPAFQVTIQ